MKIWGCACLGPPGDCPCLRRSRGQLPLTDLQVKKWYEEQLKNFYEFYKEQKEQDDHT